MSKEIITPQDLLKDLEYARKIEDKRILVLYLDLHMEHFVERIYSRVRSTPIKLWERLCSIAKGDKGIRFKIKYLIQSGHLDPMFASIARLIYDLRCKLIHQLRPDESKLADWITNLQPSVKDDSGLIWQFLNKADPWVRLQLFAFPLITKLYHRLEKLSGRNPTVTIEFHINPEGTLVQMNLRKPRPGEQL